MGELVQTKSSKEHKTHWVAERSPEQPILAGPFADFLALQDAVGNHAVNHLLESGADNSPPLIQTKLVIGRNNDRYEQEADQVADRLMHMLDARPIRLATLPKPHSLLRIQRRCEDCDEELQLHPFLGKDTTNAHPPKPVEEEAVQAKLAGRAGNEIDAGLERYIQQMRQGGQPLPEHLRSQFEPHLGIDLGQVRIHTDASAVSTAQALNARAFTIGKNVVFAPGQFAPNTPAGRHLLAHELTHVVQQNGGSPFNRISAAANSMDSGGDGASPLPQVTASPGETVQGVFGLGADLAGPLVGYGWLMLPRTAKTFFLDKAIDANLAIIDRFPGKEIFGELWMFVKEGLSSFFEQFRKAEEDVKITVLDKFAEIIAGQNVDYMLGMLKGLLKGFFLDGLLGIFLAIWDLIKRLSGLWDFFKRVGEIIGGFPEEMETLLQNFESTSQELWNEREAITKEVRELINDPSRAQNLVSTIVTVGKAFAKEAGAKLAQRLLKFFSEPGSEATVGEATGHVLGMALFEVIFAIVTAGGGVAVTGAKATIRAVTKFLTKIASKVARGFITLFTEARLALGKLADLVKAAARLFKSKVIGTLSRRFTRLLDDIREFFAKLVKRCHESALKCNLPGKKSKKKPRSKKGPSKPKKVYPDFEDISAALQKTAQSQAQRLSSQLGIRIPQERILSAPWVGRTARRSRSTSQGWLRYADSFWRKWKKAFPADAKLLGPGNTVTPQLAKKYRWPTKGPNSVVGEKLVHHHIENGPFVVAIPKSLHEKLSSAIHAVPRIIAEP